ncbi:lipopolysaccharide biosynthesis protein [Priestia megaterium]|uniref:lipopolysaccharide biosynthesis protein n=1 Tax=Priestia megaterium TaxID=1404 RepID=UPI002FFD5E8A
MGKKIKNYLNKNSFIKNVLLLVGGTSLGQLIVFLSSPILTRIYSPTDMGILGTFTALFTICVVFGSLRFEMAIPLPKKDNEAAKIVILCMYLLLVVSFILSILILFAGNFLLDIFNMDSLQPFIWLLPLSVIGVGLYQIFEWWAVRKKTYSILSKTKITQSSSMVITQIVMGIFNFKPSGLLIGSIIGYMGGSNKLATPFIKEYFHQIKNFKFQDCLVTLRKYSKFSGFSLGSGILNNTSQQLPVILLGAFYGIEVAGFFSLTIKVIGMPTLLISRSVGKVYLGEISAIKNSSENNLNHLNKLFINTTLKLGLLGLVPFLLLGLVAPEMFQIFFGTEWITAGYYLRYLSIMYFLQFIISPVAQTMIIFERTELQFYYDIIRFVLSVGSLLIPYYVGMSVITTILIYSITMSIMYLINLFMNYSILKGANK